MTNELKTEQGVIPANTAPRTSVVARMVAKIHVSYTLGVESVNTVRQSAGRAVPALRIAGMSLDQLPHGLKTGGNAEGILVGSLETSVAVGEVEGYGELDGTAWQITEVERITTPAPLAQAIKPAVVAQEAALLPPRVIRVDLFTTSKVPLEEPIKHIIRRLNREDIRGQQILPEEKNLDRAA